MYYSGKGFRSANLTPDRSTTLKHNYVPQGLPFVDTGSLRVSRMISKVMSVNTIVQEHLLNLRIQNINHPKMFCVESMLDEFSTPECGPFLEPYLDYRKVQYNKNGMILELAYCDRGLNLSQMTKFEKAIIFKDIREHLLKLLMALSFLKARFVRNAGWLLDENVKFDLDSFEPRITNFVVIDVLDAEFLTLDTQDLDMADVGGENQGKQIKGGRQGGDPVQS